MDQDIIYFGMTWMYDKSSIRAYSDAEISEMVLYSDFDTGAWKRIERIVGRERLMEHLRKTAKDLDKESIDWCFDGPCTAHGD